MSKNDKYIKELISVLPHDPGVYQYFDANGTIIYIGKAKNLFKRVSSYFVKNHDSAKTRILVNRIADIKHIVVETEEDALLLENNLIKKFQPKYNVLLKDDKSFPWICIKNEEFPRVFSTRNIIRDGSTYFGPYTSLPMVKTILDFIRKQYKLRTCKLRLNDENINAGKYKTCLEYHIGNCNAPCIGRVEKKLYDDDIEEIRKILKGNIVTVINSLKERMISFSSDYEFEKAQHLKEKIELLDTYRSKSTIVNPAISNVDVFSIIDDEKSAYVNFIKVVDGAIIQAHTFEMKKRLDESREELLPFAIAEMRQEFFSNAKEIIVPFDIGYELKGVAFTIPQRGDKKKLLDLSTRNVFYYKKEKQKQYEKANPQKGTERILNRIKEDLRLTELPVHIECFDNSNIQGQYPVAACVVFKNAKPAKKDYRHFNIKTVEGPDDFSSMEEVIYRRYKRLIDEEQSLPQLIVIDGGKGQLSSAVKSLDKLQLRNKISIIGIAKKLEEIYFPDDSVPLYLDKNSESLKVIQHLRNEAHRFGITFHRNKRSKDFIKSELLSINGVGEKIASKLLKEFKSVKNIIEQSEESLSKVIGNAKGKTVYKHFHN